MNTVRFELIELPYPTLARFGLTQEMIEDLPMRVLDEICDGLPCFRCVSVTRKEN